MINFFKKTKKEPQNLKEVLSILKRLEGSIEKTSHEVKNLKEDSKKNLQKVGIIRFNPFREAGGDQSFSIAVLDAQNNGFVMTSLYGHNINRVYAKPVNNGVSSYTLSKEELAALNKAMTG